MLNFSSAQVPLDNSLNIQYIIIVIIDEWTMQFFLFLFFRYVTGEIG